jgi:hypothetical protein
MRVRLPSRATWHRARTTWRTKRWVRIAGGVLVIGMAYGAGQDSTVHDPRQNTGPGNTATISQLEGKWDGVGTLPDGTPFCLVGWPCEDGFLDGK